MMITLLYTAALLSCLILIATLLFSTYLDHKNEVQFLETMRNHERFDGRNNSFIKFNFHRSAGF